jgi:fumarate hydratase, class II
VADQEYRIERDLLGEVRVPRSAYWGVETQRAVENFPISDLRFPRRFLRALGIVKKSAALANIRLGLLSGEIGEAISRAAQEVMEGKFDDQFVVDVFQTGSGTSTNMNANEIIANRANEILGGKIGDKTPVHPNDHVNRGQSSNDVIPTCIHVSALESLERDLLPALQNLQQALEEKAEEFDSVLKIGRTHLQDATPIRLGQEFSGYAAQVARGVERLKDVRPRLGELAIGGTAVGTGLNTHPEFARLVVEQINEITGLRFREAENHFAAQGSLDTAVETGAALKTLAVSLFKMANDIRWLGSGPRCGIGEIRLPELQAGSSIMPGKINPVIPEALCQVAVQVIGNDAAGTLGGLAGNFELNTMMPLLAYNLLVSLHILTNASFLFAQKCVRGLQADKARCSEMIEKSLAMVTALTPKIGYDAAAAIAREAYEKGKTIRELLLEKKLIPEEELEKLLDPLTMTGNKK